MKDFVEKYRAHRIKHPDAVPIDKLLNYEINGNEFGRPLTNVEWALITKVNKNTVRPWRIQLKEYIRYAGILNEDVADAIVKSNITKQKGQNI